MPKGKKTSNGAEPGVGHNGGITEDQERALRIVHVSKLRSQMVIVDRAKAELDAHRAVLTDLFHLAKAETRFSRKELTAHLEDMKLTPGDLIAAEERRATLRRDWNMPVGFQATLDFDGAQREEHDEQHAKGLGYAAGLRGDACEMPEGMHKKFAQSFAAGWGKGQEELSWALSTVGKIVDRAPDAGKNLMPAKPDGDGEDEHAEV